jgi:hypothetical protein
LDADLTNALQFVVSRIHEEAERSGAPLDDDEDDFLKHLPTAPTNPLSVGSPMASESGWPSPALRDLPFERLCELAKSAHLHNVRGRPEAEREWAFAAAILRLKRHPMAWLLEWAGIKAPKHQARWDRFLLISTALLIVSLFICGVLGVARLAEGRDYFQRWILWITAGCVYSAFNTFLFLAVRRLEVWKLGQDIQKGRCDLAISSYQRAQR